MDSLPCQKIELHGRICSCDIGAVDMSSAVLAALTGGAGVPAFEVRSGHVTCFSQ